MATSSKRVRGQESAIEAKEDHPNVRVKKEEDQRRKCPYLDTINRQVLDFDMEKLCSVTLTNMNVYCCLVCGKFFHGRGKNTPAFTHSVQAFHHVFMNLHSGRIYCLPDSYEVIDSSLDDIKASLDPRFTPEQIASLDHSSTLARDVYGVAYLPGFVGLNNLKCTDYVNVVLHALGHVRPLRNYFLQPENYAHCNNALVQKFGEVLRKMWSRRNFKSVVSPQELLQAIATASKKRFRIGEQAECMEFLSWFLNTLHQGLGGTQRPGSSIIHECFQGTVQVVSMEKKTRGQAAADEKEEEKNWGDDSKGDDDQKEENEQEPGWQTTTTVTPFLFLSLDIPPTPLFKDAQGGNIIPQVPLYEVLEKFNGQKWSDLILKGKQVRRQYLIQRLPDYLLLHLVRFKKNNFYVEKNPTIVNFPVKNLEMRDYVADQMANVPSAADIETMSVGELKRFLAQYNITATNIVEKQELVELAQDFVVNKLPDVLSTKYDLVANICHDSPPGESGQALRQADGSYRVHVLNKATQQWYEIQDLHVTETMPQAIGLSESYLLVYQRKGAGAPAAAPQVPMQTA